MEPAISPGHPLRKFFTGLVEQVFMSDMGICDPRLTDYVSEILADFVHIDRIYRLRTVDGEVIREISRLHAEARVSGEVSAGQRDRMVHRYIGDFTLFWTGVYPESLRPRSAGRVDRLQEYLLQGKRSYGIASELTHTGDAPPADLLHKLSEQFEYCVHGLHLVRAGWEQLSSGPGEN